ncbi:MAG: (5-formylfuran-3-yl)methyl phosphate synthase [Planctomycetota bacterium]
MRPSLLISVRDAAEARSALAGGADVIDVKEPARGPLGAPDRETFLAVMDAVARRTTVTLAAGELLASPGPQSFFEALEVGPALTKVGFAGCAASHDWEDRLARLAAALADTSVVPVAYADNENCDSPRLEAVIKVASKLGLRWFMIDTFDKRGGGLIAALGFDRLRRLVSSARAEGLRVALAGSLRAVHLPAIAELRADIVGVRGAACRGVRVGAIEASAVAELRQKLLNQPAGPRLPVA